MVDSVTYHVRIDLDYVVLYEKVHGKPPTAWTYEDVVGVTGARVSRSSGTISRLFAVQTWASLDGVDVKVRSLDVDARTAGVEAAWPKGAPEGSTPLHPDLVIVGDRGKGYECIGEVDIDRLTDVWEWAEIDGPIESNVRPMTTRWMGEEDNGEPWRRPTLPREKLLWRPEAQWGPWGRIEIDPLA
ncbi:hypothetical protein [Promicromonospora sp. NPDC057488]|uniref:hypothetical protein n=1 Tax=Promicromonospora sp. NPDC057488 TaxID=3346147 RepID=UPI003672A6C4